MSLTFQEKMVHVTDDHDGLSVRHVLLRGSNADIGYKIATIAKERYHFNVRQRPIDPLLVRCQNEYFLAHYPEQYERMKGIASVMDVKLEEALFDCSVLPLHPPGAGCSCVFFPGNTTESGSSLLSRNFDFSLDDVREPYVFEVYPDQGYPALYLCGFDLLGGVLDGINAEGLTVAVLADDESPMLYPMEPSGGKQVGLHELQIMRYLLDRCRNVDEAKKALLSLKHHYVSMPLHYLIGDRHGRSFVWENSYTTNQHFIIEGAGEPQAVTNFLLHRYQNREAYPKVTGVPANMYERYEILQRELLSANKFSMDDVKRILACVFDQSEAVNYHTLWHNVYNTEDCSMEISFYTPNDTEKNSSERTKYYRFQLSNDPSTYL